MLETIVGIALVLGLMIWAHGALTLRAQHDKARRLDQRVAMAAEAEETRRAVRARLPLD